MFIQFRKHSELIWACAFVSLVCLIVSTTSLVTQEWTSGNASVVDHSEGVEDSTINHGLFKGTLIRRLTASPRIYDIYLTCIDSENVCSWSCVGDADSRKKELERLVRGEKPKFNCPSVTSFSSSSRLSFGLNLTDPDNSTTAPNPNERHFLNAGMFYSTIFFVIITVVIDLLLFLLSVTNCLMCPKYSILNTSGMIILSSSAFFTNALGIVIYGCNYDYWIIDNIGILDTIVEEYKSESILGYSYWIFVFSSVLSPLVIVLISVRNGLLRKDRAETVIIVAQVNDPTTVLY